MDKRTLWRNLTRIHKWAGLALGAQLLVWFSSGFFMSFFAIDTVRGEHVAENKAWNLPENAPVPIAKLVHDHKNSHVQTVRLFSAAGHPVYELIGAKDKVLIDALNGQKWQGLQKPDIIRASAHYYTGTGQISMMTKLSKAPIEYRSELPVWQVQYADAQHTRLYISPQTGALLATRTRLWRVYDFMWMLHIMDYQNRDNFNNWWLKLLSFCALLFGLTGIALLTHRILLRPRARALI